MPVRKRTVADVDQAPGRTIHQRFEYREIPRTAIRNAGYNPRVITPHARKKLRASLAKDGLVEPLVWNTRTGHLVGGHQRLAILDDLEGRPDYTVGVAVVDLDLRAEKALNVALNNPYTQGAFDADLFVALLKGEEPPAIEDMGFTLGELELEFGELPELADLFQAHEMAATDVVEAARALAPTEAAAEEPARALTPEQARAIRQADRDRRKLDPAEDADYYLMVVFRSRAEKEAALRQWGRPADLRLLEASELRDLLSDGARWPD